MQYGLNVYEVIGIVQRHGIFLYSDSMVTWLKWSWANGPQKVIKQVGPEPNTMTTIVDETRCGSSMSTNGKNRCPIHPSA